MSVQVGFPVVFSGEGSTAQCEVVWVTSRTRRDSEPPSISWNDKVLDERRPFGDVNPVLTTQVLKVAQTSVISFRSALLPTFINGVHQAAISGPSAGLLMSLAEEYELPPLAASSHVKVLVTGAVDPDSGRPKPTCDSHSLQSKAKFAKDLRAILLVHRGDYQLIDAVNGRLGDPGTPIATLPGSVSALAASITAAGSGRAFAIPDEIAEAPDWKSRLGRALGLHRIERPTLPGGSATHAPQTCAEADGTLRSLFAAATPTFPNFLAQLPEATQKELGRALRPNTIAASSIGEPLRGQLFCARKDRFDFEHRHVFIGGPTGSGKTFLAEALMLNTAIELGRPVLYIGPTRALVYQLHQKFTRLYCDGQALHVDDVVCSTGEYGSEDRRLRHGDFRVAFVVNEKANLLLSPDQMLLSKVGLVVVDEAHMVAHGERGGVLDMMLAKLLEQNRKRMEDEWQAGVNARPLRIALISTEATISDERVVSLFSSDLGRAPIKVATSDRLVPVDHRLVVLGRQPRNVSIVRFASDADRRLSPNTIDGIVAGLPSRSAPPPGSAERRNIVIDLLEGVAHSHKRILVVCSSIKWAQDLSRQLKNRRKEAAEPPFVPEEFNALANSGMVARSTARRLVQAAEYGIFFHHAELPRSLRAWLEGHFEAKVGPADRAEFVFTTETLVYGVNLAADCVVLLDLRFRRNDPATLKSESTLLDPISFHNMLGRVGRPAYADSPGTPLALICVGGDDASAEAIRELLDRYYGPPPRLGGGGPQMSTLILRKDLRAAREETPVLDDFSYTTFRAVMDGLRHQALGKVPEYASGRDVLALMKSSIYWYTRRHGDDQLIAGAVDKLLSAAADENGMELVARSASGPGYTIRPQAEALIDTGTTWKSVRPIREWLDHVRTVKEVAAGHAVPVEYLIPGFVVSIDLWRVARTFAWEFDAGSLPPQEARENERRVYSLMHQEAARLADEVIAAAFCEELGRFVDRQDLAGIVDPALRRAAVYRLVTALMRWLRGAPNEQVELLSLRDPHIESTGELDVTPFQVKIYDRASWLAVMCLRFFGVAPGQLLAEHVRELFRLSLRLRHGVAADGLAFIQDASPGSKQSRLTVDKLLERGLRPSTIITGTHPIARVTAVLAEIDTKGDVAGRAELIVRDVLRFYEREVSELLATTRNEQTREAFDVLAGSLLGLLRPEAYDRRFIARGSGTLVRETLLGLLRASIARRQGVSELALEEDVLPSGRTLDPQEWFRVVWDEVPPGASAAAGVEVWHPWPPHGAMPGSGVHLTVFGGVVLAALVARDFVRPGQVQTWARSRSAGVASVRDLVSELPLKGLPTELREILLAFEEPGLAG